MIFRPGQCWRCGRTKRAAWEHCPWCGARIGDSRTALPPNKEKDVQFLVDLCNNGWPAYHTVCISLYESLASPGSLCEEGRPETHRTILNAQRIQHVLRAQTFAEYVALMEAFGMLCLAIRNRRKRSMLWSYFHTEPQDVEQFFQNLAQATKPVSFARALGLPSEKRIAAATNATDEQVKDFETKRTNLRMVAQMYRDQDSLLPRAYNKVKHGFLLVEGSFLDQPLGQPEEIAIMVEPPASWSNVGVGFFRLAMSQADVDRDLQNVQRITSFGADVIGLTVVLHQQGLLY